MPDDPTRYRFGPFVLDPAARQLGRDGVPLTLPPKAFDILVLLVRTRDRVLTKQELLDTIWPETAVIENTLTQRIKEIREALADVAQEPTWVKTIPRVGYRFIGEVIEEARVIPVTGPRAVEDETNRLPQSPDETVAAGGGSSVRRAVLAAVLALVLAAGGLTLWYAGRGRPGSESIHTRIESLAVLPMENLSQDPQQEYFADGMTEELITELARIPSLRVISRTSVARFKNATRTVDEIGRELNVDAIVEGSVLRDGSQARITLKLVEVATDRTLLAESYSRELQDVLALQSQIARALADRVRLTVTARDDVRLTRRVVPEALDDYLRARSLWNSRTREGVTQALELFRRAVDRDPAYAEAWAGIADCHIVFSGALLGLSEREAYPRAREAALRALALDETLAEAHTALGSVLNEFDWDWRGAEAEYTRAIALNASHVTARQWYGEFLSYHARHDESLIQLRHAVDLDPLSPVVNNSLALALLAARRYEEALARARRTLEIDPAFAGAHLTIGTIYQENARHADAIGALQQAVALSPGLSRATAWLGHAYAVAGQTERARKTLADLQTLSSRIPVSPYDMATVHAGLGDPGPVFDWLDRAYEARTWDLVRLKIDGRFDKLRADPRFQALLKRIGLPEQPQNRP